MLDMDRDQPPVLHNPPTKKQRTRTRKGKKERDQSILSLFCSDEDLNLEQPFSQDSISSIHGNSSTTTTTKTKRKRTRRGRGRKRMKECDQPILIPLCNDEDLNLEQTFGQGPISPLHGNSPTTVTMKEREKKEKRNQAILGSWCNGEDLYLGQFFDQDSISPLHGNSLTPRRKQGREQPILSLLCDDEDLSPEQPFSQDSISPLHSNSSTTVVRSEEHTSELQSRP